MTWVEEDLKVFGQVEAVAFVLDPLMRVVPFQEESQMRKMEQMMQESEVA